MLAEPRLSSRLPRAWRSFQSRSCARRRTAKYTAEEDPVWLTALGPAHNRPAGSSSDGQAQAPRRASDLPCDRVPDSVGRQVHQEEPHLVHRITATSWRRKASRSACSPSAATISKKSMSGLTSSTRRTRGIDLRSEDDDSGRGQLGGMGGKLGPRYLVAKPQVVGLDHRPTGNRRPSSIRAGFCNAPLWAMILAKAIPRS